MEEMENQHINEIEVNRREESLVTRHPGFMASEQFVRDVAAERQIALYQFHRILWTLLAFLQILLAFRFILRMVGANPNSGFAILIYGVTGVLVGPFIGMLLTPTVAGFPLEITTLIAMLVYALLFGGIEYVIWLVTDLPMASSFIRTTREQMPGGEGNVRSTRTTIFHSKL
jgi:hypothetical protein